MSSSEAIHQCVLIHPKPEKLDQVRETMKKLANITLSGEAGTYVWSVHERDASAGEPMMVIWEIYENAAARLAHRENPEHAELVRALMEDGLLVQPPEIMPLNHFAGNLGPGVNKHQV